MQYQYTSSSVQYQYTSSSVQYSDVRFNSIQFTVHNLAVLVYRYRSGDKNEASANPRREHDRRTAYVPAVVTVWWYSNRKNLDGILYYD